MATRRPKSAAAGATGPDPGRKRKGPTGPTAAGKRKPTAKRVRRTAEETLRAYVEAQPAPSKLTMARLRVIEEGLSNGLTQTMIADLAGITRETMREWRESHPPVSGIFARAEARFAATALGKITLAIQEGDWRACAWFLERRRPSEFARTQVVEGEVALNWAELVAALGESENAA